MQKMNKKLSKWLSWIHIVLTFGGPLAAWIISNFYRTEIVEFKFNNNLTLIITLIVLIIIFGQLIFPINIVRGLIIKKDKTSG